MKNDTISGLIIEPFCEVRRAVFENSIESYKKITG